MFKVMFFDELGNPILDYVFNLNCLPDQRQIINIGKHGIYVVLAVMLKLGEDIETIYAVVVEPRKQPIAHNWNDDN